MLLVRYGRFPSNVVVEHFDFGYFAYWAVVDYKSLAW